MEKVAPLENNPFISLFDLIDVQEKKLEKLACFIWLTVRQWLPFKIILYYLKGLLGDLDFFKFIIYILFRFLGIARKKVRFRWSRKSRSRDRKSCLYSIRFLFAIIKIFVILTRQYLCPVLSFNLYILDLVYLPYWLLYLFLWASYLIVAVVYMRCLC